MNTRWIVYLLLFLILLIGVYAAESSLQASVQVLDNSPFINIIKPNQAWFGVTSVLVNITMKEKVKYLYYRINTGNWGSLCSNCNLYSRSLNFPQGKVNLTFWAVNSSNKNYTNSLVFYVDSIKPVINSYFPLANGYTNGKIGLQYTEANVLQVILDYGTNLERQEILNCGNGTRISCNASLDLTEYDNQYINYSFIVKDNFFNATSAKTRVKVDTSNPVFNSSIPEDGVVFNDRGNVVFNINLSEPVTLKYKDNNLAYAVQCSNCNKYLATKVFSFGQHNLTFIASDYAGNIGERNASIIVTPVKPIIHSIFPAANIYSDGTFKIQYTDLALDKITLFYGTNSASLERSYDFIGCENGVKVWCNNTIDLSEFDGKTIYYQFFVKSALGNATSTKTTIKVDITPPVFNSSIPEDGVIFNDRGNVVFNINLSEPVTLKYKDNNLAYAVQCSNCNKYLATKVFSFGQHNLTFIASDYAGNTVEKNVTILVTPIKPIIHLINPVANTYATGKFSIQYTDLALDKITLFYGTNSASLERSYDFVGCENGVKVWCNNTIDLSEFDGKTIYYQFLVKSTLGNSSSTKTAVKVDTIIPSLNINSPQNQSYNTSAKLGYSYFNLTSSELVTMQYSDNNKAYVSLSTGRNYYSGWKYLGLGQHNVTFRAYDPAGNTVLERRSFILTR